MTDITITIEKLKPALRRVAFTMDKGVVARWGLCGMHVMPAGADKLRLAATDGRHLATYEASGSAQNLPKDGFIIARESVMAILGGRAPKIETTYSATLNGITVAGVHGIFPEIARVIPEDRGTGLPLEHLTTDVQDRLRDPDDKQYVFNPKLFAPYIRQAKAPIVQFDLKHTGPALMTCADPDYRYVIMPMRV